MSEMLASDDPARPLSLSPAHSRFLGWLRVWEHKILPYSRCSLQQTKGLTAVSMPPGHQKPRNSVRQRSRQELESKLPEVLRKTASPKGP